MLLGTLTTWQQLVEVLPTDDDIIRLALNSGFSDFEDAVQYYTASAGNASYIVTRNPKDFGKAVIPVYTPTEFLQIPYWLDESNHTILNDPEIPYRK